MKHILTHDRTRVIQAISEAPDGHTVEIKAPSRTADQNALYWKELQILAEKTNQTAPNWHEWLKRKFLPPEILEVNSEVIMVWPSTTKLSKQEFSEYLEEVFSWIAQNT